MSYQNFEANILKLNLNMQDSSSANQLSSGRQSMEVCLHSLVKVQG